jgi:hypothetical protein
MIKVMNLTQDVYWIPALSPDPSEAEESSGSNKAGCAVMKGDSHGDTHRDG